MLNQPKTIGQYNKNRSTPVFSFSYQTSLLAVCSKLMGITRYFDPQLNEELRLRSGIVRKNDLVRTESFRQHFKQWQRLGRESLLANLRSNYEAQFFSDDSSCEVLRRQQLARVKFNRLDEAQGSGLPFLLEELRERACASHYHCFGGESWKILHAEEGVAVHQRYLFRRGAKSWMKRFLSRWLKSELLVIETIAIEKHTSSLEIRLYPDRNKPLSGEIDQLMAVLLR